MTDNDNVIVGDAVRLSRQRAGHRSYMTRLLNDVTKKLESADELDRETFTLEFSTDVDILRDRYKLLEEFDVKVLDSIMEEAEIETEIERTGGIMKELKLRITWLQKGFEKYLGTTKTQNNHDRGTSHSHQMTSKLPKLSLLTFDGDDVRKWPQFWDTFKNEIDAQPLNDATKFRYLMSCLKGKARSRVSHYMPSGESYGLLCTKLRDEYGSPEKIQQAHIDSINKVFLHGNTINDLREFFDGIQYDVNSLRHCGMMPESYGAFVVPTLFKQLPAQIQLRIFDCTEGKLPTLPVFLDILELELKKRETLEQLDTDFHSLELDKELDANLYQKVLPSTVMAASTERKQHMSFKGKTKDEIPLLQNQKCIFCDDNKHMTRECQLPVSKKFDIAQSRKLCYRCLGTHFSSNCKSKKRCSVCKSSHHSALHDHYSKAANGIQGTPSDSKNNSDAHTTHSMVNSISKGTQVILKTAKAKVYSLESTPEVSVFFDEGSQLSYITSTFASKIKARFVQKLDLTINSFGGKSSHVISDIVTFDMATQDGPVSVLTVVVPKIVEPINQEGWSACTELPQLCGLQFADRFDSTFFDVDVLIGADQTWKFIRNEGTITIDGLLAQDSSVGYLISGNPYFEDVTTASVTCLLIPASVDRLDQKIEGLFQLDRFGFDELDDQSKVEFNSQYRSKIEYSSETKQYIAPLPWKTVHPPLPCNLSSCSSRLNQLKSRLLHLNLFTQYGKVLLDHEEKGFIERVVDERDEFCTQGTYYLPHFFVLKPESTTTPLRIVFAANAGKVSLNDCLETGPCLLNDLMCILIKFRVFKYAFTADIAKAFLTILISEQDRDYLRFLWFEDHNPDGKVVCYRYKCLNFGPTCAPYILNTTIQKHLEEKPSWVTSDMYEKLYVDNLVSGTHTEKDAIEYYNISRDVCSEAKMNLRQWSSNSQDLLDLAKNDDVSASSDTVGVLGMSWNSTSDILRFSSKSFIGLTKFQYTKRFLLSKFASLFDPYGFLSPLVLLIKYHISELWDLDFGWDDSLPEEKIELFEGLFAEVQLGVTNFSIPRWYSHDFSKEVSIHLFCDASFYGLGCVVYLVQGTYSSFVISKVKIVSRKKRTRLTIPRLELMAMEMGARLLSVCFSYLKNEYSQMVAHCWTDSEICLHWLHSTKTLKLFIQNRVQKVREFTSCTWWSHVRSEENPADVITRGCTYDQLISNSFISGPSWLSDKNSWPPPFNHSSSEIHNDCIEQTTLCIVGSAHTLSDMIDVSRFSSYTKLIGTIAIVLKFVRNKRSTNNSQFVSEHNDSERVILKLLQHQYFQVELDYLEGNQEGKKPPLVHQLGLFIDSQGLIRTAGRFEKANIPISVKYPILIPKNSHVTNLIIRHFHNSVYHSGLNTTLSAIRQKFWLPCGRSQVKSALRHCVICKRYTGRVLRLPNIPALPDFRLNECKPFSAIGIDFSGHLLVKYSSSKATKKVYFCIFSCCTTRNINIELVEDMTTESFLLAFRAHCADFSFPHLVISDNAPTFKQAAEEISQLFKVVWDAGVHDYFNTIGIELRHPNGIHFRNIPVKAPWWGGFYERTVGMVKMCMKKVLGRACIHINDLRVLLKEIRSVINDRPLTYVSSDSSDIGVTPLSPSLLLYGFRISSLPNPGVELDELVDETMFSTHVFLNYSAKRRAHLFHSFVRRFQSEYFHALRERHSYQEESPGTKQFSVGDVFLLKEIGIPRGHWRLVIIEKLLIGSDGKTRAVELRTSTGKTNRPISSLVPLEISVCQENVVQNSTSQEDIQNSVSQDVIQRCGRPRRQASEEAKRRILSQAAKDL